MIVMVNHEILGNSYNYSDHNPVYSKFCQVFLNHIKSPTGHMFPSSILYQKEGLQPYHIAMGLNTVRTHYDMIWL